MAESALGARGLSGVRTMLDELAHMPARVRLDIGALVRYGLAPPDFEAAYALTVHTHIHTWKRRLLTLVSTTMTILTVNLIYTSMHFMSIVDRLFWLIIFRTT